MSRWVIVKGALGAAGLIVGLFGMALEQRVLVWVAIAFLLAAFLTRFIERRGVSPGGEA